MLPPFDDAQAMAVFADMLTDAGDPRGELIHLQLAREHRPADPTLRATEERFIASHGRALLGSLRTATSLFTLTWRRGYVVEATLESHAGQSSWVRGRWVEALPARPRSPRLLASFLELESSTALQLLRVRFPRSTFGREQLVACAEVVANSGRTFGALSFELLVPGEWWNSPGEPGPTVERQLGPTFVSVDTAVAPVILKLLG
ncbi:MAG: hypothetical protein U0228_37180 [Myxococcaceae bacterium]